MSNTRITLLLFCFLLAITRAGAQPYYFRHYQVENGLSNNTVQACIQDRHGFLWFGTKEGLNRFDGYHFRLFRLGNDNEQSLTNNRIYCLFTDSRGTLWIGAERGLFRLDEEKEHLAYATDSLQNIHAIQSDLKGQIWFLSGYTVCRYNPGTGKLKLFLPGNNFPATTLCMLADGSMWFGSASGGLYNYNETTETFTAHDVFAHSAATASRWIQAIKPAGNGSIYVGTSNQGLKQFDVASSSYRDLLTYNSDHTTIFVRDILRYSDSEFWFATESGIFILDTRTGKFTNLKKKFLDPYSISDNAVYTLCKDREGGIWAGTYFGGVNYYHRQYSVFQKYFPDNSKNSISGNAVREICEDRFHNIWIGTEDAGLNRLNASTGVITHYVPSGAKTDIAYSNIHGLLATGNELWIGTFEHGLDIMDIRTGKIKKHYSAGPGSHDMKSNFVVSLLQTSTGQIYLGSSNGLYQYNAADDNFSSVKGLTDDMFVSAMMEDHRHTIWICTYVHGVYYFNPLTGEQGHFRSIPDTKNSFADIVSAIWEDSRHDIWFATEGGLHRLDSTRQNFLSYTMANGMPSNYVFKVIEDDRKTIWASTSRGLVNIDPLTNATTVYTQANGLVNDQFNYSSGYKDGAGKLYFGSLKGMITFRPADLSPYRFSPPVYITGFQARNKELMIDPGKGILKKSILYTRRITLPYNESSFNIDFAALSYASPEMTGYSYKMEGLDKEWTDIKSNRRVYFTNLSPGTYEFRIKAAVEGVWGHEKTLTIHILPPLWATPWAYAVYAILVIALLYYLVSTYHKRTRIKKEKEIYEAKIDFFTNVAHEIKTPLTLIKGPLEYLVEKTDEVPDIKEDVGTIERNTNRLIGLVTQILDFRQTETRGFSLDFSRVDIRVLLKEVYSNFKPLAKKRELIYTMQLPQQDVIVQADEEALNKIFSNLFSNAVKYAQKEIHISLQPLKKEDNTVTIVVSNDGFIIPDDMKERIFEPFYRLRETARQKGTGIGLALARSLAELHNGRLYVDDRPNGMNNFVLLLPLRPGNHTRKRKNNRGSLKTK